MELLISVIMRSKASIGMEMSRIVYEAKVGVLIGLRINTTPPTRKLVFLSLTGKVYQYSEAHRSAESWTKGALH